MAPIRHQIFTVFSGESSLGFFRFACFRILALGRYVLYVIALGTQRLRLFTWSCGRARTLAFALGAPQAPQLPMSHQDDGLMFSQTFSCQKAFGDIHESDRQNALQPLSGERWAWIAPAPPTKQHWSSFPLSPFLALSGWLDWLLVQLASCALVVQGVLCEVKICEPPKPNELAELRYILYVLCSAATCDDVITQEKEATQSDRCLKSAAMNN